MSMGKTGYADAQAGAIILKINTTTGGYIASSTDTATDQKTFTFQGANAGNTAAENDALAGIFFETLFGTQNLDDETSKFNVTWSKA